MDINTMLFNVAYANANKCSKKSKEVKKVLTKVFFKLESGGVGCEIAVSARVGSNGVQSGVVLDLSNSTQISCAYLDT